MTAKLLKQGSLRLSGTPKAAPKRPKVYWIVYPTQGDERVAVKWATSPQERAAFEKYHNVVAYQIFEGDDPPSWCRVVVFPSQAGS